MTISPQSPILSTVEGNDKLKKLDEDHLTFVKVGWGYSVEILIKSGFTTDGASIPEDLLAGEYAEIIKDLICLKYSKITNCYDLNNLIERLVGTPWDMPRLLAAIVHDALYGRKWKFRWLCDKIYRWILSENSYDAIRADIEYCGIRLVGWKNWDVITDLEQMRTKRLTEVKFIRNKKIPREIENLKKKKWIVMDRRD